MDKKIFQTPQQQPPLIRVVAGVLRNKFGDLLISSRPKGKPYEGYWEFPGGKINPEDRSAEEALARELHEEIDIKIDLKSTIKLGTIQPKSNLKLSFYAITHWQGAPSCKEGQCIEWVSFAHLTRYQILPTNFQLWPQFADFSTKGI